MKKLESEFPREEYYHLAFQHVYEDEHRYKYRAVSKKNKTNFYLESLKEKKDMQMNEVLYDDEPVKAYFDLEIEGEVPNKEQIIEAFGRFLSFFFCVLLQCPIQPEIVYSESHKPDKFSVHATITNIGFVSNALQRVIVQRVTTNLKNLYKNDEVQLFYYSKLGKEKIMIDTGVYKERQYLRMLYQSKTQKPDFPFRLITSHVPEDTFVNLAYAPPVDYTITTEILNSSPFKDLQITSKDSNHTVTESRNENRIIDERFEDIGAVYDLIKDLGDQHLLDQFIHGSYPEWVKLAGAIKNIFGSNIEELVYDEDDKRQVSGEELFLYLSSLDDDRFKEEEATNLYRRLTVQDKAHLPWIVAQAASIDQNKTISLLDDHGYDITVFGLYKPLGKWMGLTKEETKTAEKKKETKTANEDNDEDKDNATPSGRITKEETKTAEKKKETKTADEDKKETKTANDDVDNDSPYERFYKRQINSGSLAILFSEIYDEFVSQNGIMYRYNGIYWNPDLSKNNDLLFHFVQTVFYPPLNQVYLDKIQKIQNQINSTNDEELIVHLKNKRNSIKVDRGSIENLLFSRAGRNNVIKDIIQQMNNNDIKFNAKKHLFPFTNAVFDFKLKQFITPRKDDYISKTCGWAYEFGKRNSGELEKLLPTIFPDPQVKHYFLSVLSSAFTGEQVPLIVILQGEGGNGKSVVMEFAEITLGPEFFYTLPQTFVTKDIAQTGSPDPQTQQCHEKRMLRFSEPNSKQRIRGDTLKKITGDKTFNARGLWSSNCNVELCCTLFGDVNTIPLLDYNPQQSDKRRWRIIPFPNKFVSQAELDALASHPDRKSYFLADARFKSPEFQLVVRQQLFDLISQYAFEFYQNNKEFYPIPPICQTLVDEYFGSCDTMTSFFDDNFIKTENPCDFIYLSDALDKLKTSSFFLNLPKSEQRKLGGTKANFKEEIQKNLYLGKYFRNRDSIIHLTKDGQTIKTRVKKDILVGWKKQEEENIWESNKRKADHIEASSAEPDFEEAPIAEV
jgi:phage/plasmid-associated DNA primase